MSRVAKKPIQMPKGVDFSVTASHVTVKGPKGTLSLAKPVGVEFKLDDGVLLELGRDQAKHPLAERVSRFTNHYAAVSGAAKGRMQNIGAVDMRYPNGFALRPKAAGQS